MEKEKLRREKQCAKCPWKKSTNPYDIPDGYSVDKHCALEATIADPGALNIGEMMRVMACHESSPEEEMHCVGWLMNQLDRGNNISLRIQMMKYDLSGVRLFGGQLETFEDTLPCKEGR